MRCDILNLSRFRAAFTAKGWALLPLQLLTGFGFAAHGYAKLSRGPGQFASILAAIGVPLPHAAAWVTSLLEFFGGVSIMAGAFVALLSLPLIVIMLTAMFSVHLQYGFSSIRLTGISASGAHFGPIGYEMNLLYIASLLTLAISAPTRLSVDYWLAYRRRSSKEASQRLKPRKPISFCTSAASLPGVRDPDRDAPRCRALQPGLD